MRFETALAGGTLLRRYKRFLADVRLDDGTEVVAHCPNPGSMLGCLHPEQRVLLSPSSSPRRKLAWTLELLELPEGWMLANTLRPNALVSEALQGGRIAELAGYASLRREVPYGAASRVDLVLDDPARPACYVEIKSVTLGCHDSAWFPDAVTRRGTRHLHELVEVVRSGKRAVLLYLVGRPGCQVVRPADRIDPAYGRALREAHAAGVEVLAYQLDITASTLEVGAPLEVDLTEGGAPWPW